MSSLAVSLIAFAFIFGGALLGMSLRGAMPQNHLSDDSKDSVKLGMGLVATMCALVLGLLIASAKTYYDTQNAELTEMSAKIVLLDRMLAHYGPETNESRALLRDAKAFAEGRQTARYPVSGDEPRNIYGTNPLVNVRTGIHTDS